MPKKSYSSQLNKENEDFGRLQEVLKTTPLDVKMMWARKVLKTAEIIREYSKELEEKGIKI